MIRVGIIGTGIIAHDNYEGLMQTGRCEVVGICNRTLEKGQVFADKYRLVCPVFSDYKELYRSVNPDAVLINTPHDTHEEIFSFFAEHHVNIMIEKPLANSKFEAERMIKSAHDNNIRAGVCHTQRYNALIATAKDFINKNNIGRLISYSDIGSYNYYWKGRPGWFLDPKRAGGGIVMNYGVHAMDRLHFLTDGKVESIAAHIETEKENVYVDSSYHIMGTMSNGLTYFLCYTGYSNPASNVIEMRFTEGILRVILFSDGQNKIGVYFGNNEQHFSQIPLLYPIEERVYRQMDALLDCMEGKPDSNHVSIEYAAEMVHLIDIVKHSYATQRWIWI